MLIQKIQLCHSKNYATTGSIKISILQFKMYKCAWYAGVAQCHVTYFMHAYTYKYTTSYLIPNGIQYPRVMILPKLNLCLIGFIPVHTLVTIFFDALRSKIETCCCERAIVRYISVSSKCTKK